ncbi:MAG: hypothetical protein IT372_42190, partial [Polyangiaceae bacterium]|nr:hypothetical protein [Polyangiaceae bacterium]
MSSRRAADPASPARPVAARAVKPAGKDRRALTNVGGPSELHGDPALAAVLAAALDVRGAGQEDERGAADGEAGDPAARAHVHGFH